jgi:hypothetical protein
VSALSPTCDPFVLIEEQREGYVRYVRTTDGRRWEVHGVCDRRGDCWEGAVGPAPELDCPVTPEFRGCCPFTYVELEPAKGGA